MGGYIFHLSRTFSRMPLKIKPLTPLCLRMNPIKRYNQASKIGHQTDQEIRAPSTAEEFKRVAEQKLREAEQGVKSQLSDEARVEKAKHDEPGVDCHRRVDHHDDDEDDGR